jgi:hypothetical protein
MKLTDFDNKTYAPQALKENYKMSFDVSNMTLPATKQMLKKVRTLAMETKQSPEYYKDTSNPAYMKLVFMEQALVHHFNDLAARPQPRIVLENEKIEESQVYLAAQDMVDSVNKMLEQVGQMQVKELPALVDSIESEIGVNESNAFQEQVGSQLDTLGTALREVAAGLKSAVGELTGTGGGDAFGADMGMGMEEPMPGEEDPMADVEVDQASMPEPELPAEEPEMPAVGGVGREKR